MKKNRVISIYNSMSDKKSQLNSIDSFNDNIDKRLTQLNKEIELIKVNKEKISADLEELLKEEKKS